MYVSLVPVVLGCALALALGSQLGFELMRLDFLGGYHVHNVG